MKEHYFDDLKIGDRFRSEPLNVTEKEVIEFAHKFDPQMFHLNHKAAERTLFKGLIASGWHTAALTMRLFVQTLNFAEGAIGLGVDELRWPNAVRPKAIAIQAGLRDHSVAQRDYEPTRRDCSDNAGKRFGAAASGIE
jgi:acyl dehydratase